MSIKSHMSHNQANAKNAIRNPRQILLALKRAQITKPHINLNPHLSNQLSFYSAGTTCMNNTPGTGSPSTATGYSVKFGVYDALGKQVQEFAF